MRLISASFIASAEAVVASAAAGEASGGVDGDW